MSSNEENTPRAISSASGRSNLDGPGVVSCLCIEDVPWNVRTS